ncbi:STAS-like domain-containing protein [Pedobacter lithocola]|uniref:STAS-like domain-containing protein n=1 Tax=Pedobacter lithocola TaxID=1908239 RepID=A0ABV8P5N9_9SPHI
MKIINLDKYGPIISDKAVGDEIYYSLKKALSSNSSIEIDLIKIHSMATFCAKQIFGKLYIELGSSAFFEKIILKNATNDLKTIIQIGVQDALDENNR